MKLIFDPHEHLPRAVKKPITGIRPKGLMFFLHDVQCEREKRIFLSESFFPLSDLSARVMKKLAKTEPVINVIR